MGICGTVPPPTLLVSQPLSPCVSVPHHTPNSPSQKGSQRREGPGVPGVPIPSCLTSSRGPWRPLGGFTPRMVTFSCGPVLPAADIYTPQRTEKAVLGPGHTGLGLTSVFSQLGGLGQIVHLTALTVPFCQMGRQLQPLQGLVPGTTGGAGPHCFLLG